MARQKSDKKKREETRKNLEKMLIDRKLTEQIYQDKIDEYMSFYDNLKMLNEYLNLYVSADNLILKDYKEAVGEARRISSEMRNILTFLGLKPEIESGGGEIEEL